MKRLTVWAGPVLSSKSTRALGHARRIERMGKKVCLVRPTESVRKHESHGLLRTRAGIEWPAAELECASFLEAFVREHQPDVLWIDEPMLWPDEQVLYELVQRLRSRCEIMLSGCPATSELEPFGQSFPKLIAVADDVIWCKADCDFTHTMDTASRSVCLVPKSGQKLVGGAETYKPASVEGWNQVQRGSSSSSSPSLSRQQ